MKIEKVIRRVSDDGKSVLNAAVAANIGEPGQTAVATATSAQHTEIRQRHRPTEKES